MTLTVAPTEAAVRSLFAPDGTPTPEPVWDPEPVARQEFYRAISRLGEAPEFATGTHVQVWGRALAGWDWLGWDEGFEEHVHLYRHADGDQWALVPISTRWALPVTSPVTGSREGCFDAAEVTGRRAILAAVVEDIRFGCGFEAVTTHLLGRIRSTGQPGDHPCNVHLTGRLRVLCSFASTPHEQAMAMLAALSLP